MRDGLRWHLVEPFPGRYDFSSVTPFLIAARDSGTQVIWDLLHYGLPEGLDVFAPVFVTRFARFARAVAQHRRELCDDVPYWCPINEISFHSWAGGDVGYLNPFARGRGFELKVQLARAAIAAMAELRAVDARARFVQCEPAIVIHPLADGSGADEAAERHEQQYQAFDLLAGRLWPQIGGAPDLLDIIGLNYYVQNQWRVDHQHLGPGDVGLRPMRQILAEVHARYGRPMVLSETGIEAEARAGWFTAMADEVLAARAQGLPIEGLCLYPVVNHVGWDDDRICPSGLLGHEPSPGGRSVHVPLAEALARMQSRLRETEARPEPALSPHAPGGASQPLDRAADLHEM